MPKHRTIDQALDMFDAWEAATLERRQREGQRSTEDLLRGLQRRTGVRIILSKRRRVGRSPACKRPARAAQHKRLTAH